METPENVIIPKFLDNLPPYLWNDWAKYKGEVFFVGINYDKSIACKRPIIDLYHCATQGLNDNVLRSVNYNPAFFEKHEFSRSYTK